MKENSVLKRLLSVLLTVAMIVSLVAIAEPTGLAQAAEAVGVYSEDFESGAVLTTHAGSGSQENRLETETNSYLQLTGLTATQLATPAISVEENTEYVLSYRVKAANVSGNFYFYVSGQAWNDSNEYSSLEAVPGAIRTATDGWQTVQGTYTFSKNHVQFFFEEAWGGSADVCLDDITLTNTATGEIVYQESFDTTASLSVRWGNPTQTRAQEEQPEYYLQLTGASAYSVKTEGISIKANTEYVLSYRVKVDNVSGSAYFYTWRQEWDDSGNYSGVLAATEGITAATDGWQTVEVSFTSGKNHVQFVFEQAWNGSADVCLDDITLKAVGSETAVYCEDFTDRQEMTVLSAGGGGSQSFVQDGNHYLALLNASAYLVKTEAISIEANTEYTLSYRVKVDNVSGSAYFYTWRQEWDDSGNYSGVLATTEGITAATDGWQTVEISFTSEKNYVQFFFEQAWSGSADICLDDIQLTKASEEPAETEPTETEPTESEPTEPEINAVETALSFNRVDGTTWFLDAANVSQITGSYYFATVNVDGSERKVVFEKIDAGFVIYEGFFTVYGGTSVPQNSFEVPEGTVLYQFDPNVSWNDPISGGQQIVITQALAVKATDGGWYEYNDTKTLDFALYDYTTVEIGADGWQVGTTTSNVSISNGMIIGQTGDTADANVLTLMDGSAANRFTMEAGTQYRFSVTYQSTANLMFFCGDWISVQETAVAAKDWKTISVTFTADRNGKLPIYIQNWGGEHPEGQFRIKAMYIAKVSDTKTVTDGEAIGTLPNIDRIPSDNSYQFVWSIKNQDTGTYTQITEKTVYDSQTMGKVVYTTQVRAGHGPNAHWWTTEGASVTQHVCSVCGEKEAHSYAGDVCTACQYDMGQALHFALFDYTSVDIGQGGWDVGATTGDIKVSDGIISGETGETTTNAVLSLYNNADLNPFVMEGGMTYRVSLTYRSEVKLMFFCDEWISFTKEATAAEDWKTVTVTVTPDASRKLAIYVQNWDGDNPIGKFQIKDIHISRISDSRVPQDGSPIGAFPEIDYAPSDEFCDFVWRIQNKEGSDYITVTPRTVYDSNTMGTKIVAKEIKVYHSILNYVRCDFTAVDSWTAGSAMKAGSYSSENGILQGVVLSKSVGQALLSFGDGANRLALEPGVEYKVIMTYRSAESFGVFMNLKSNAWVEAPGKCLPSSGNAWKTVTATFKPTAGDVFNGVLIQSWNEGKEYSFQIKDFCIVKADDTRKFAGNENLSEIPECESENDALNRYVYQWVAYQENGEAVVLSGDMSIKSITSALNETGMLYAYERMQCVYHMGEEYAKAATCTQEGWGPYWVCRNCGKYFSDIMCKEEITDLEAWKLSEGAVEPTGHIHTTSLLALDGSVYDYCECNKLFKPEGDTYVEVPITVLDIVGEKQEADPVVTDRTGSDSDSNAAIWLLAISGIVILIAAGSTAVLLYRRRKRSTVKSETDRK